MGCHALLQGIFLTQGPNLRLQCWEAGSLPLEPPDFISLFTAALGLGCCVQAFSSCGEQGLLFIAVRGLLIAVASLIAERGL